MAAVRTRAHRSIDQRPAELHRAEARPMVTGRPEPAQRRPWNSASRSRHCCASHSPGSAPPAAPSPGRAAPWRRSRRRRSTATAVAADHALHRDRPAAAAGCRRPAPDRAARAGGPPRGTSPAARRAGCSAARSPPPRRRRRRSRHGPTARSAWNAVSRCSGCQLLGIVEQRGEPARHAGREHHGGGDHRAGERPAPDLVHPGNPPAGALFQQKVRHGP